MANFVDGSDAGTGTKLTIVAAPANSATVTMYTTDGRSSVPQSKVTYSAAAVFTPVATATDVVMITGSPTKNVRVVSMYFASSNTLGGVSLTEFVIKRGWPNQGGTFVAATAVPSDSVDAAATAMVGNYTAKPTVLGQALGTINTVRTVLSAAAPTAFAAGVEEAGQEMIPWPNASIMDKLLTLNNVNESLVINLNGAAVFAGQTHTFRIVWTEE